MQKRRGPYKLPTIFPLSPELQRHQKIRVEDAARLNAMHPDTFKKEICAPDPESVRPRRGRRARRRDRSPQSLKSEGLPSLPAGALRFSFSARVDLRPPGRKLSHRQVAQPGKDLSHAALHYHNHAHQGQRQGAPSGARGENACLQARLNQSGRQAFRSPHGHCLRGEFVLVLPLRLRQGHRRLWTRSASRSAERVWLSQAKN